MKKIIVFIVVLLLMLGSLYFMFKEPKKDSYDFPKDYTEVVCNETFVGNVSGVCFISFDNESVVLKQGDYYEAYTKVRYT